MKLVFVEKILFIVSHKFIFKKENDN